MVNGLLRLFWELSVPSKRNASRSANPSSSWSRPEIEQKLNTLQDQLDQIEAKLASDMDRHQSATVGVTVDAERAKKLGIIAHILDLLRVAKRARISSA